jgi:hypothetical protein
MTKFNNMFIGLVIGILSPPLTFYIFSKLSFPDITPWEQFLSYHRRNVSTHVISLSVIVNLALFFIFLKSNRELTSRGILGATILYAITVVILKFT